MANTISIVHSFVWGVPVLVLIIGVGLYLSVLTDFVQFRRFGESIRLFLSHLHSAEKSDGVSPLQALCSALAATVGTGNIVGVAGAICLGGPGAVFWMWLCGLIGMATKYAEVTLAVSYRVRQNGNYVGGPMYMISDGLKLPWLGKLYAALGILACFGVGNWAQVNAVVTGISSLTDGTVNLWLLGLGLALLTGVTLVGGIRRIGRVAEGLVPGASLVYLLLCVSVLIIRIDQLPNAFHRIFVGAFSPRAATGGMLGSLLVTLRTGCSRGVFSNEAGMGTASMAHSSVDTDHPSEQGMMGIIEVFLDTMVICTMTALAILSSGVGIPYGTDVGLALAEAGFSDVLGDWSCMVLTGCMCCFAFATVLGWSLYGAACAGFLFGEGAVKQFYFLQAIMVTVGAVMNTQTVWQVCEILNGAMAIPNLIALILLGPSLKQLSRSQ